MTMADKGSGEKLYRCYDLFCLVCGCYESIRDPNFRNYPPDYEFQCPCCGAAMEQLEDPYSRTQEELGLEDREVPGADDDLGNNESFGDEAIFADDDDSGD
jgi:hypothetical protein